MGTRTLLLIAASLVSGTALMIGMSRQAANNDEKVSIYQEDILLNQIAKSAENLVLAQVKRDFDHATSNITQSHVKMKGGNFSASVTPNGDDELTITVQAEYAGLQREIQTTLQRNPGASPLDAAVMIDAPSSEISLLGTQFCIVGIDYNPPSIGGHSPRLHTGGLRTTSNLVRDQVRTAMGSNRMNSIIGVSGKGDIYHGNFDLDINAVYADAVRHAGLTHDGEDLSGTFGSAANPIVLHVTGDAEIHRRFTGYGVLVIDGDLDTSKGTLYWEGVVIVNKESNMSVEFGHGSLIYGGLIILNGSTAFNMPGNGTLDMMYYQSGSSMGSSLNIRPVGESSAEVFASGSNSSADQTLSWSTTYELGQQINFFTTTTPPSGSSYQRLARENNPVYVAQPHAIVRALTPEMWEVRFETGATGILEDETEEHITEPANWDYYDEKIIVTYVTDNTVPPGDNTPSWNTSFIYDTPMSNDPSSVQILFHGTGSVLYSSEAVARLAGLVPALSPEPQIIITDRHVQ